MDRRLVGQRPANLVRAEIERRRPSGPGRTVMAGRLQEYLRWRNAHARHPDVLAASAASSAAGP
jgi:hypothetical protein